MATVTIAITAYKRLSVISAIKSVMDLSTANAVVNFDCLDSKLYHETKKLEEEFKGRLLILESKSGGLSKSRNILLENVNSDYIFFLDDDDVITESFGDWISSTYFSRKVYRFGKVQSSQNSKKYIKIPKRINKNNIFHSIQISSYLLSKSIYKNISFVEGVLSEDIFIAKDIFDLSQTQVSIQIPSIEYRSFGSGSITSSMNAEDYEETVKKAMQLSKYNDVAFVAIWIGYSFTKALSLNDAKRLRRKYIPFGKTFRILPMIYKIRELICL